MWDIRLSTKFKKDLKRYQNQPRKIEDVNTELDINEAFDYHEPDLPYFIQQKITNAVPRIISVANEVLRHIDDNGYRTDDLKNWFLPFLILPGGLAISLSRNPAMPQPMRVT